MPVVEAVAAVVRDLEEHLLDRLGRDHLATRRDDEPFELAEETARVAVGRDDDRLPRRASSTDATRVCSWISTPASAARRARRADEPRRLQHAVGRMEECRRIAPGERRREILAPLGREAGRDERLVLLAQLVALLLVRREAKAARSSATRRPPSAPSAASSSSVQRQSAAVASAPIESTRTGYGAAPPRSAKPPFRPLAPPAISRASNSRTVMPASASASAHAQPVIPPPTTATSTLPSSAREGSGSAGSSSQYDVVDIGAAILDGSSIDTVLERHATGELELDERGRAGSPESTPDARRSSSAVSAPAPSRSSKAPPHRRAYGFRLRRLDPEDLEHVVGARHGRRAEPEQRIRAGRERARDLAGHCEHVAALLEREVGRDERAAPLARLDHDGRPTEPGDDPVARREAPRCWLDAGLVLGDDETPPRRSVARARRAPPDSRDRCRSRARRPSRRRHRAPRDEPRRRSREPCRSRRRARQPRGRERASARPSGRTTSTHAHRRARPPAGRGAPASAAPRR